MRYLSDLLTRETIEIRDRFTIDILENQIMRKANSTEMFRRNIVPISYLPFTIVCTP